MDQNLYDWHQWPPHFDQNRWYDLWMGDSKPAVRDNSLDFVRGIAILLVLAIHAPIIATPHTIPYYLEYPGRKIGGYGVDLFFVLSGFLIGGLLMREFAHTNTIDGLRFLKRRAYKLWPNYFVYVVVAGMLLNPHRAKEVLPNFLHLQNYLGTPLRQTWSLAVEEHFYLILVVTLSVLAKLGKITFHSVACVCGILMAIAVTSRIVGPYFGQSFFLTFHSTHTRIDTLAMGILLAAIYRLRHSWFERVARERTLLATIGIGAIVFDLIVPDDSRLMTTLGYDVLAIGGVAWVVLCFSATPGIGLLGRARLTKWYGVVAQIGVYSYGIYLWERTGVPVFSIIQHKFHLGGALSWWAGNAFYAVTGISIGILATKFIELPMLAIRDRKIPGAEISPLIGSPTGPVAANLQLEGESVPGLQRSSQQPVANSAEIR